MPQNRITASIDFIFQKIAQGKPAKYDEPGQRRAARDWFRREAASITSVDAVRMMSRSSKDRQFTSISQTDIGSMYMYWYDAKLKDELPYWDKLPLIFLLNVSKDYFLGINLHYLPIQYRARLMDALYTTISNRRYDETTKLRISYSILKSATKFAAFKPCLKVYLKTHVRSKFIKINVNEWDMALTLPTERFQKKRKQSVWSDSIRSI